MHDRLLASSTLPAVAMLPDTSAMAMMSLGPVGPAGRIPRTGAGVPTLLL